MHDRPDIRITCLRRDAARGHWTARVTGPDGQTVDVDCQHGSWQTTNGTRRDVLPPVAAALQERVRPLERGERQEVAQACKREERRRLQEFAALRPSERDLARRREELPDELADELRGRTLEHIYTTPELAWARPARWEREDETP